MRPNICHVLFSLGFLAPLNAHAAEADLSRIIAKQQAQIEALIKRVNTVENSGERLVQKQVNCNGQPEAVAEIALSNGSQVLLMQVSEEGYGTGNSGFYTVSRNYEGWSVNELNYNQRPGASAREMKVYCEGNQGAKCKLMVNIKDSASGNGQCTTTSLVAVQFVNSTRTLQVNPL